MTSEDIADQLNYLRNLIEEVRRREKQVLTFLLAADRVVDCLRAEVDDDEA